MLTFKHLKYNDIRVFHVPHIQHEPAYSYDTAPCRTTHHTPKILFIETTETGNNKYLFLCFTMKPCRSLIFSDKPAESHLITAARHFPTLWICLKKNLKIKTNYNHSVNVLLWQSIGLQTERSEISSEFFEDQDPEVTEKPKKLCNYSNVACLSSDDSRWKHFRWTVTRKSLSSCNISSLHDEQ